MFGKVLLGALALVLHAPCAEAAEWFVSTIGNDTAGNGSLQAPYRTIKRVLSTTNGVARAGDTITVRGPVGNNTYQECDVRLRVRLTMRSYPGERAHIHCPVSTPDSVTVQIDANASGSRLTNLEISGGRYYAVMMQTDWYRGGGENLKGASDIILEDLLIRDTGRDGIKITPKSDRVTIRRTEIRNTGTIYAPGTPLDNRNADGIDNVNGSGMIVEDSYIHDISTTGLYFKGGAADVIIRRNRIQNTGHGGILVGFDTSVEYFDLQANPEYYESIRGTVVNNLVRDTDYAGIGLYAAKDAVVANNTIQNAGRVGHAALYFGITFQDWDPVANRPATVNPRILNNLIVQPNGRCIDIRHSSELGGLSGLSGAPGTNYNAFGTGCTYRDGRPGSSLTSAGTFAQWRSLTGADANSLLAPLSLDASGRPLSNSASINAGTTVAEVVGDLDGRARQVPFDIGAHESGSVQSSPPVRSNGSQPLIYVRPPSSAGAAVAGPASAVQPPPAAIVPPKAPRRASQPRVAMDAGVAPLRVRIKPPILVAWSQFQASLRRMSDMYPWLAWE